MRERSRTTLRAMHDDEAGVTAVEYAIMGSLIAAVVFGSVALLGTKVGSAFDLITTLW